MMNLTLPNGFFLFLPAQAGPNRPGDEGGAAGGLPVPPPFYHAAPLPWGIYPCARSAFTNAAAWVGRRLSLNGAPEVPKGGSKLNGTGRNCTEPGFLYI